MFGWNSSRVLARAREPSTHQKRRRRRKTLTLPFYPIKHQRPILSLIIFSELGHARRRRSSRSIPNEEKNKNQSSSSWQKQTSTTLFNQDLKSWWWWQRRRRWCIALPRLTSTSKHTHTPTLESIQNWTFFKKGKSTRNTPHNWILHECSHKQSIVALSRDWVSEWADNGKKELEMLWTNFELIITTSRFSNSDRPTPQFNSLTGNIDSSYSFCLIDSNWITVNPSWCFWMAKTTRRRRIKTKTMSTTMNLKHSICDGFFPCSAYHHDECNNNNDVEAGCWLVDWRQWGVTWSWWWLASIHDQMWMEKTIIIKSSKSPLRKLYDLVVGSDLLATCFCSFPSSHQPFGCPIVNVNNKELERWWWWRFPFGFTSIQSFW